MALTGQILEKVDTVLIPVLPSPLDLWAGASTVDAVQRARARNPGLRAWLLLNQVEPSSALSRAMSQALARLDVPTLVSMVRRRAAFRTAAVEGVSVYQLGARGREAAREMDQVLEEVFRT
jgi:chromosome partitioning protein